MCETIANCDNHINVWAQNEGEWGVVKGLSNVTHSNMVPPAALVCRVDSKDVQLFFVAFLRIQAEEVLPVLVQVVDQVPVEAVLSDNVGWAWERHRR